MSGQSPSRRTRAVALGALAAFAAVASTLPVYTQAPAKAPAVTVQHKVGPGLYELAVSESTGRVFVAAATDSAIHVLDAATLKETTKFSVSGATAYGMALNDKTQTIYTTNTRAGNVSAIDAKTGKVIATIADPAMPNAHLFSVIVDEDTNTIYAVVAATPGAVWVIDGKTNTLASKIADVGQRTTGLAIDKAANKLYVASMGSNDITVVDLGTKAVTGKLPAGGERPTKLAFDAKTGRLFVTNQGTGDIGVIDTKTGQLVKSVKTGAGALGVGFNAKDNAIYVANRGSGTVTVIDNATLDVVADLKAGTLPNTVAIDRTTGAVYVTNKGRGGARAGAPRGGAPAPPAAAGAATAPAGAPPAPPVDESGDTVTLIKR